MMLSLTSGWLRVLSHLAIRSNPRYPNSARRKGVEGTVLIKAYVTDQGRVEQLQIEQSAGHADLDEAAVEAVGRWRFEPACRGRQPIAMWVSIPVRFMLNG
jgi:protein TonB